MLGFAPEFPQSGKSCFNHKVYRGVQSKEVCDPELQVSNNKNMTIFRHEFTLENFRRQKN
jgi:hypothetical protein